MGRRQRAAAEREQRIHICYALSDASGTYAKYLGASMHSVLANTQRKVSFHLLYGDEESLPGSSRKRFEALAEGFAAGMEFHYVRLPDEMRHHMSRTALSPATLYRLYVTEILPDTVGRIIYLDGDTIVGMDIAKLWDFSLQGHVLGAVQDIGVRLIPDQFPLVQAGHVPAERYFNAGVLLMDLARLREKPGLAGQMMDFIAQNRQLCRHVDQDALNYFLGGDSVSLPGVFNRFVLWGRRDGARADEEGIWHYAAHSLGMWQEDPFDRLFWHHFAATPWMDEGFLWRIFSEMPKIAGRSAVRGMDLMRAAMGARMRICVCGEAVRGRLQERILWREGQDIYLSPQERRITMQDLTAVLAGGAREGKCLILCVDNYPLVRNELVRMGYEETKDFVDGSSFLLDEERAFVYHGSLHTKL
ncbi:MAG: glycosyltransferase family 8 protein [Selenomonadaceae bacterium]|nr:glycosyltransferase family 8 protein [Selenomonadaceae bacterium]